MARARILLGWELGDGLGHVGRLLPLAERFAAEGYAPVFAVRDPAQALRRLGPRDFPVLQAPFATTQGGPRGFYARSHADILALIGYQDPERLAGLVRAWRDLAALVAPCLAIGDFAPTLALALAGGATRVLLVGSGFSLPPAGAATFPVINPAGTALADPVRLRAAMAEIAAADAPLPRRIGGDAQAPCTWPLLDPYRHLRQQPALGPIGRSPAPRPRPARDGWFAYLAADAAMTPPTLAALAAAPGPGRIYLRGGTDMARATLAAAGHHIHAHPPPLADELAAAALVIHHGGIATAETALAMGVPQLVLSRHLEQHLNGRALEAARVGRALRGPLDAARIGAAITVLRSDEAIAARAARIAAALDRRSGALERVMALAHRLIAQGGSRA